MDADEPGHNDKQCVSRVAFAKDDGIRAER